MRHPTQYTARAHKLQSIQEPSPTGQVYCTDSVARLRWKLGLHPYGYRYLLKPVDNVVNLGYAVAVVF